MGIKNIRILQSRESLDGAKRHEERIEYHPGAAH
jgi:hypothetical protein